MRAQHALRWTFDGTSLSDCNKALIRSTWWPVTSAWTDRDAITKTWTQNTSICPNQPAPAPAGHVFTSRAALLTAVHAWCVDKYAAAAIYGPINGWNVSQITDLSQIFYRDRCERAQSGSHFNDFVGDWDTSSVTTLYEAF